MPVNLVFLRRSYFVLAGLATLAALVAICFPRWPRAQPLNAAALHLRLKSAGLQVQQLQSRPPTRTYDLASSPLLLWKLPDGQELSLMRGSSREFKNFQVAFLARAQPSLQLEKRKLITTPFPLALGNRKGKKIWQTCILVGQNGDTGFGVTNTQLSDAQSGFTASKVQRILAFIGVNTPPKNTCVLMSISAPPSSPHLELSTFQTALQAITSELVQGDPDLATRP